MAVVRQFEKRDETAVWRIFKTVVASGDTYVFNPDSTLEDMRQQWLGPSMNTYVACMDETVVGTYFIKANAIGLGNHVCNAGFMVDPDCNGRGVGRAMIEHALVEGKTLGFHAMQFNMVVADNERAVKLWRRYGFEIIGRLPKVFRNPSKGMVDAFIMHRFL